MEAQNHFYGHSAALAAYTGLTRPKHIAGLLQHGWTAGNPVETHFRDFPALRADTPGRWPTGRRELLVWSHSSRAWSAGDTAPTRAIGAPWLYLSAAAGQPPAARRPEDETVILPVHGIETQRIRGDHDGLAREWARVEGRATVCLYAADARDPEILGAYQRAGHRCVVLGARMDAAFLWRLWTMLGRARRVVSNRLSTPVVYAAHLGADVAVYGDPLHLDGEASAAYARVSALWPEFHGVNPPPGVLKPLADAELGTAHVLPPDELARVLGWDRRVALRLFADYWLVSPGHRALTNVRRRRGEGASRDAQPVPPTEALGARAWFLGALSYLPRPLPRTVPEGPHEPLPLDPLPVS